MKKAKPTHTICSSEKEVQVIEKTRRIKISANDVDIEISSMHDKDTLYHIYNLIKMAHNDFKSKKQKQGYIR